MTLTLDFPPDVEEHVREQTPDFDAESAHEARIALALDWFRKEKIGISQLAKILGMTRWEANGWLKARGEYAQSPTMEELEKDFQTVMELAKARGK